MRYTSTLNCLSQIFNHTNVIFVSGSQRLGWFSTQSVQTSYFFSTFLTLLRTIITAWTTQEIHGWTDSALSFCSVYSYLLIFQPKEINQNCLLKEHWVWLNRSLRQLKIAVSLGLTSGYSFVKLRSVGSTLKLYFTHNGIL